MYCKKCGHKLIEISQFCSQCGMQLHIKSEKINEKDLVTTNDLKYFNGMLFSGISISEWEFEEEYYEDIDDEKIVDINELGFMSPIEEKEEALFKTIKRKREVHYKNGKINGLWRILTENDLGIYLITHRKEYVNGELIRNSEFNIDGTYKFDITYENGLAKLSKQYLVGNLWLRTEYLENITHKEEYYHKTGQLSLKKSVTINNLGNEQYVGTYESYNENGTPLDKLFYNDKGIADGIWKRYNENGELFLEQTYTNGKLIKENYQENKKRAYFLFD